MAPRLNQTAVQVIDGVAYVGTEDWKDFDVFTEGDERPRPERAYGYGVCWGARLLDDFVSVGRRAGAVRLPTHNPFTAPLERAMFAQGFMQGIFDPAIGGPAMKRTDYPAHVQALGALIGERMGLSADDVPEAEDGAAPAQAFDRESVGDWEALAKRLARALDDATEIACGHVAFPPHVHEAEAEARRLGLLGRD